MPRSVRILTVFDSSPAADPPEAVNVESDFVVILAALLCALICVVGLIAVARCAWLRRGGGAASGSPSQATANKGLKKKVIQSLPKFTYGVVAAADSCKFASTECAICLGEFSEKDEIRILPQCGHGFHVGCIDTWLGSHSSCPSCRQILGVARCQKCGQIPSAIAISSSSSGGAAEADSKPRVDDCNFNNDRNNNQRHNLGDGFLP